MFPFIIYIKTNLSTHNKTDNRLKISLLNFLMLIHKYIKTLGNQEHLKKKARNLHY